MVFGFEEQDASSFDLQKCSLWVTACWAHFVMRPRDAFSDCPKSLSPDISVHWPLFVHLFVPLILLSQYKVVSPRAGAWPCYRLKKQYLNYSQQLLQEVGPLFYAPLGHSWALLS